MSKEEDMAVIESADYEQTRQRLMQDPIVIEMAEQIKADPNAPRDRFVHNDDPNDPNPTPQFWFMQACNEQYSKRTGKSGGHVGAIAEAILRLVNG